MSATELFAHEAVILRHLVSLLLVQPLPEVYRQVEQDLIPGLSPAYFLLAMDRSGGVERFVTYHLGRIVQQFNRYTEQKQVIYAGQARGRVLWSPTFKTRYTEAGNPYLFVCQETKRRYDTPENQLVKYVMDALLKALQAVPELVRSGACYFPAGGIMAPVLTATRLHRMETALNQLRYHVRLREVTLPTEITTEHLTAAANARMEEYAEVIRVYRLYYTLCEQPQWGAFLRVGHESLPLPGTIAGEGEKWLQVAAAILQTKN